MFFISGKNKMLIKEYSESQQSCKNCKTFNIEIEVFSEYFHLYLIPFFPTGTKTVKIHCGNCQDVIEDQSLREHYEKITKNPFYIYSGPILVVILISLIVNLNLSTQDEKARYAADPKVGDVYMIRNETFNSSFYTFFKIVKINDDTISAYQSNAEYEKFTSNPAPGDYYNKERKLLLLRSDLKTMLNMNKITSINREDE
ncbi:MAG: hypothetical protein H0U95_10385 [Bacteroidetes bacterium]|nr:hypothetical protein [Bacteroidota bacterium]